MSARPRDRSGRTSALGHLVEDLLPVGVPLRQWVLTVPFGWRKRLGYDGPLLSALTRLFVKTVLAFYRERGGGARGQSGAVVAVQRKRDGDELEFRALAHLTTRDVAAVLERTRDRMTKYLRCRGLLDEGAEGAEGVAARCLSRIGRWCSSGRCASRSMGSRCPPSGITKRVASR